MNKKILFLLLTLTTSLVSMEINHSDFSMFKSRKEFSKAALAVKPIVKKEIEKLKKITKIIKKPKIEEIIIEDYKDVEKLSFSKPNTKLENISTTKKEQNVDDFRIIKNKIVNKKISEYSLPKNTKTKKIQTVSKIKTNTNIQELELEEPVKLYGFHKTVKIKRSNWSKLFKLKDYEQRVEIKENLLAKVKKMEDFSKDRQIPNNNRKQKNSIDRISTAQAANEKSLKDELLDTQLKITNQSEQKVEKVTKSKESKEDLVFFDYSAEVEKSKGNVKVESSKSTTSLGVSSVVKKSSNNFQNFIYKQDASQASPSKKADSPKVVMNDQGQKALENAIASLQNDKKHKNNPEDEIKNAFLSGKKIERRKTSKKRYKSDYSVFTYSIDVKNKIDDHKNFEIRFKDDVDDIRQDYGEGRVQLKDTLSSSMAVRRGTILSSNHYPTTVDFVLENNEISAIIPLFTRGYLNKVIQDENVTGLGAQLLVELDDTTEDIDVDLETKFEKKIYLNKNLKVVSRDESDYSFIMLLGVRPGNTILTFRTTDNKYVSKIVHLEEDEVYFDSNFYINKDVDEFSLFEEKLLSKTKLPLSLDSKEIRGLTFETKVEKQTINKYKMKNVKYPLGTRSYLELKHLSESVFVGRWDGQDIDIPSETYMRFVLDQFRLTNVNNQCLIQINLGKSAKELYYNGSSSGRTMRMQSRILDNDGMFYEELSHESKKIFLMGEEQGIVSIKVTYTDNTIDYLQSYCSQSTYLVEQL